jgi:TetR/AcrR family transcriptional regulator, cholesterol catabolism regulator
MSEAAPDRRAQAPRRRQREIIEAATRVFHEKGYESTSIQDIADTVGILKGSLYYYITSKEDLLFEIIQGVHAEALQNIERTEATRGDALQKIRTFVHLHLTFNAENLVKMGVFFHDFRSLSGERRAEILDARDLYDRFLRELIRQGQESKIICPDIDPKVAAIMILGMMNWIYQWYHANGEWSVEHLANDYADFVVVGLACDAAQHSPGHRRGLALLPAEGAGKRVGSKKRAAA